MKPFVVNRHGRIVFPSNFFPELDFSVFETLEQFEALLERDFEAKAPAASIPLAIYDAVQERVIDRPKRIFAPGFGAGAVGGYAVLRIDPAIVAAEDGRETAEDGRERRDGARAAPQGFVAPSSEDVRVAFGD